MTNKTSERPSFTLIELMVVIVIIGILSGVGVVSINNQRAKARNATRLVNAQKMQLAFERYYQKNGRYPYPPVQDIGGTKFFDVGYEALANILVPNYIDALPKDPLDVSVKLDNCSAPPYSCTWPTSSNPAAGYYFGMHIMVTGKLVTIDEEITGDDYQYYLVMAGLERPGSEQLLRGNKTIIGDVRRNVWSKAKWIGNSVAWDFSTPHLGILLKANGEPDFGNPIPRQLAESQADSIAYVFCGDFSTYFANPTTNPWDTYHASSGQWANLCVGNIKTLPKSPCVGEVKISGGGCKVQNNPPLGWCQCPDAGILGNIVEKD